jgi:hypothetical protein
MSTLSPPQDQGSSAVEVLTNDQAGTVTFVSDRDTSSGVPPTEWLTVSADAVVSVEAYQ